MGLIQTDFFENTSYELVDTRIIVCNQCLLHLCLSDLVISDKFTGLSGDAYLVDRLINVQLENKDQETHMKTGIYVINKIHCLQCLVSLGWQYKKLFKCSELYKEGKYVIEKRYIRHITNHSSTARLVEQAKVLRRRRSSASFSALSVEEDEPKKCDRAVVTFRHGLNQLSRRFAKDDFDEHDEDTNVFVDA